MNKDDYDDGGFARLFDETCSRPRPSLQAESRAYAAARAQWQATRRVRQWRYAAVAAGFVVTAVLLVQLNVPTPMHHIAKADAGVLSMQQGVRRRLTTNDWVADESTLATNADSGVRVVLAGGNQLRIDTDSRLRISNRNELHVQSGRLYVIAESDEPMIVHTPNGRIRDIGTRFEVAVRNGTTVLAMRDGLAEFAAPSGALVAKVVDGLGDVLSVDNGHIGRSVREVTDPVWDWTHALAPEFGVQPRTLTTVEALASELGFAVRFASPGVQAAMLTGRVGGDIRNRKPREALDLVLKASELHMTVVDRETIEIDFMAE